MKVLTLTGLGSEQSFVNGKTVTYFLVFNEGEFRVPVTEESAMSVIKEMYGTEDQPTENTPEQPQEVEEEYAPDSEYTNSDDIEQF